jgi:hypothetical protein
VDAQKKQQIKKVMDDHLKSKGWPNVSDPDMLVMNECENMFRLLLKQNLVKYTDWDHYYMAAISQYERAQMRKAGFNF